jgi:putative hydrolase of the HAD superfamily
MNLTPNFSLVPWQNIDTVLLDMDGTLLDLNYDNQIFGHLLPAAYAKATRSLCGICTSTIAQPYDGALGHHGFLSF